MFYVNLTRGIITALYTKSYQDPGIMILNTAVTGLSGCHVIEKLALLAFNRHAKPPQTRANLPRCGSVDELF